MFKLFFSFSSFITLYSPSIISEFLKLVLTLSFFIKIEWLLLGLRITKILKLRLLKLWKKKK